MAEGALTWFANRASASTPVLQDQEPEVGDLAPESTPVLQNQEPAARRLARDGNWYTFAEFSEHDGRQAEEKWQDASSSIPVLNYTRADFDKYYGDRAESKWEQAPVSPGMTSRGAPQPASSSGSGNFSVFVNALSGEVRYCNSLEEFYDRIRAAEGQEPPIAVGGWVRRHFVGALTRRSRKAQAAFIRELREGGRLVAEDYAGEQWCKTLPPRYPAPPPGGRGLSTRADPAASAQGPTSGARV